MCPTKNTNKRFNNKRIYGIIVISKGASTLRDEAQMNETLATTTKVNAAASNSASPTTITIFGAAGDLAKRLVVPALYNLVPSGRLPDKFSIIGVDHNGLTTETWRQHLTDEMRELTQTGG